MTYTSRPIAPFKIDILSVGEPSSYTAGQKIPFTGTPKNTLATISSGQLTVYEGSNWRIEYSPVFTGDSNGYCQFKIQFYSITDSAYIGQAAWGTTLTQNHTKKGRVVATALILSSEISTSKVIEARIVSQSGITNASSYDYVGKPTLRVMELPV